MKDRKTIQREMMDSEHMKANQLEVAKRLREKGMDLKAKGHLEEAEQCLKKADEFMKKAKGEKEPAKQKKNVADFFGALADREE